MFEGRIMGNNDINSVVLQDHKKPAITKAQCWDLMRLDDVSKLLVLDPTIGFETKKIYKDSHLNVEIKKKVINLHKQYSTLSDINLKLLSTDLMEVINKEKLYYTLNIQYLSWLESTLNTYLQAVSIKSITAFQECNRYEGDNFKGIKVIAKVDIPKNQKLHYLLGYYRTIDDETKYFLESQKLDFSIMESKMSKTHKIMLGPAAMVNHDCNPNCKYYSNSKSTVIIETLKNIQANEELLCYYGSNYFDESNKQCACLTCESKGEGHFEQKYENSSLIIENPFHVESIEANRILELRRIDLLKTPSGTQKYESKVKELEKPLCHQDSSVENSKLITIDNIVKSTNTIDNVQSNIDEPDLPGKTNKKKNCNTKVTGWETSLCDEKKNISTDLIPANDIVVSNEKPDLLECRNLKTDHHTEVTGLELSLCNERNSISIDLIFDPLHKNNLNPRDVLKNSQNEDSVQDNSLDPEYCEPLRGFSLYKKLDKKLNLAYVKLEIIDVSSCISRYRADKHDVHEIPYTENEILEKKKNGCAYCIYCGIFKTQLPRHLRRVHYDKDLVKHYLFEEDMTLRNAATNFIRNQGYGHIKEETGIIIPAKNIKKNATIEVIKVQCNNCLGHFSKKTIAEHQNSCHLISLKKLRILFTEKNV